MKDLTILPSFLLSPLILPPLTPGAASLGAGSRQLWLAKKKLLFLTSWANENLDLLTPLTKVVEVEYGMMVTSLVPISQAQPERQLS